MEGRELITTMYNNVRSSISFALGVARWSSPHWEYRRVPRLSLLRSEYRRLAHLSFLHRHHAKVGGRLFEMFINMVIVSMTLWIYNCLHALIGILHEWMGSFLLQILVYNYKNYEYMKNKCENGRCTWTDQVIYVQVILHKPPISQGPTQT